jgi:hypothetical protein
MATYNFGNMTSNSPLSRFENFARYLIEGSFDRLLRQPGPVSEVAGQLAKAAERSRRNGLAANRYAVKVHPSTLEEFGRQSTDAAALMEGMLAQYGQQNQLVFAGELRVEFEADPSIGQSQVLVITHRDDVEGEPTAVLDRVTSRAAEAEGNESADKEAPTASLDMTEAYLIINGRRHVVLDRAVNSIGRSLENDIVLEDPGVSRSHAQIRWRNGRFEIFDLGSRAGMLINGQPLSRGTLKSGDVITLGSAAIIYGEDDRGRDGVGTGQKASVDITQELSADDPT